MEETSKRELPVYLAPGKRLFQVVVHMKDAPGSLSSILDKLVNSVNMVSASSYSLKDGTAVFSSFAEALADDVTAGSIKEDLASLDACLEARVEEGKEGLLVDTFHTGFRTDEGEYMLLRRDGVAEVFDHIVKIFGTGGEVLLYEEGKALGKYSSVKGIKDFGRERVLASVVYLSRSLTSQGWGLVDLDMGRDGAGPVVKVSDCFECSGGKSLRKGCDFFRGYCEGIAEGFSGRKAKVEETECTLRGDKGCVFAVNLG